MTIPFSDLAKRSVGQMFGTLDRVLTKGAAAAKAKGVDEGVYLNWRMATDMHPMKTQVQFATEVVRQLFTLAGTRAPEFINDEVSFDDLHRRLQRARTLLDTLSDEALDRDPDEQITVPIGDNEMTMTRVTYFQNFILPNLYFHTTATYLILRHLGVDLGKGDYLGPLRPRDTE